MQYAQCQITQLSTNPVSRMKHDSLLIMLKKSNPDISDLSHKLQTYADFRHDLQLESYRRPVHKPRRPPRAIDNALSAQSLSNQNISDLSHGLQASADLRHDLKLESYQRLDSKPGHPTRVPISDIKPKVEAHSL